MKREKITANVRKTVSKKRERKKSIMKQLGDPNISSVEKNRLLEKLYKGIAIQ